MPRIHKRSMQSYLPSYAREDDEIEFSISADNLGDISASGNYYLLTAEADIRIIDMTLVVDTDIALSGTNYWDVQLVNLTMNDNLLATADTYNKTVAIMGDTAKVITMDQNRNVREDSVLELQLTKNASADNLSGLYVSVKYVVTGSLATTTSSSTTTTTTSSSTTSTSSSTTTTSSSTSSSTSTSTTITTTSSSTTTTSSSTTTTSSSTSTTTT